MPITALPLIKRLRQNHALEHATLHVLGRRSPSLRLMGRSDLGGFSIYGVVESQAVALAVAEGLARLQNNESRLAVHPRCGTNVAVAGMLAGSVGYAAASLPGRWRVLRFAATAVALAVALVLSRPLGLAAQQHVTTCADLQGLRVRSIRRSGHGRFVVHRVSLGHAPE